MFGSPASGSSFCGSADTSTALYDQNVEIKNSVFYKNNAKYIIALGNSAAGEGYTKLSANIHNNFFYDAVCINTEGSYWGVFLINSAKSGVDYVVNVTDNIIHQQTTSLITLFNGNVGLQKSKTTLNFNRNKVTGKIDSIYPATSWNSSYYNFINTSLFYDFFEQFPF
ncbi:MAG: hypothetical protein IKY12_05225 [Clostridia bacterium]|nr:hypothetical protein [Clostridia bacterium]